VALLYVAVVVVICVCVAALAPNTPASNNFYSPLWLSTTMYFYPIVFDVRPRFLCPALIALGFIAGSTSLAVGVAHGAAASGGMGTAYVVAVTGLICRWRAG
jgi:hypothetical protein